MRSKEFKILALFVLLVLCTAISINAQVRSGAAFLKMLPGARAQSMGNAYTAVWDDPNSIYANPGAAGFLREWQWSAGYTKWIADIYNASFIYGRNIAMPWSKRTRFAVGVLYQGMPSFNNDPALYSPVTANDLTASFSIGQPLSKNISIGGNLKYFKSTLAEYSASTYALDGGIVARAPRVHLGNSVYSILSVGGAVTQYGKDLTYDLVGTPIPRTWRGGLSLYTGSRNGLQLIFSTDYIKVKDEDAYVTVGAELTLSRILSVNAGYNMGNDLFKKYSLGAGIRLDDAKVSLGKAFPGRHNAFRLDLATLDDSDVFSRTYRGTATHFPTRPEKFGFIYPSFKDSIKSEIVELKWNKVIDPDIFDELHYRVFVDSDSNKIAHLIHTYDNSAELFFTVVDEPLLMNLETQENKIQMENLSGGEYYWAVAAIDRDNQVRFAQTKKGNISQFSVPLSQPDLLISDIKFVPNQFVNLDAYQGNLQITIQNIGDQDAENFLVRLDDNVVQKDEISVELIESGNESQYHQKVVNGLGAGENLIVEIEWHSKVLGTHEVTAKVDCDLSIQETDEFNNEQTILLYTVPKGSFTTADTAAIMSTAQGLIELPFITEMTFADNSATVKLDYLSKNSAEPLLIVLAERLIQNRHLGIELKGFADPNSGEFNVQLADARSQAVKDSLLTLGVNETQVKILPGEVLPERTVPANAIDAEWVFEERRFVYINAAIEARPLLFHPIPIKDITTTPGYVSFECNINSCMPLTEVILQVNSIDMTDSLEINTAGQNFNQNILWKPKQDPSKWENKTVVYNLTLVDTLGREFSSRKGTIALVHSARMVEQRMTIPLKFGKTDPLAHFYWEQLFNQVQRLLEDPEIRLQFEGHACAIGPKEVNERLSLERAVRFTTEFINYIKTHHTEYYDEISKRIDKPVGFGESKPLTYKQLNGNQVLVGDNSTSIGRKLNRRIEMVFYKNGIPHNPLESMGTTF